jgi:uncharacterized OB-fold protein
MSKSNGETIRIDFLLDAEYKYSAGRYASRFFFELRENCRIMGMRCNCCDRVYIPPRPVCGICCNELEDWEEVKNEGVIVGYTVVRLPFIDPMTGQKRPIPYGFAIIRLDGTATGIYHFLDETDETKLYVGQKVKAVFREKRNGSLNDIIFFRPIGE